MAKKKKRTYNVRLIRSNMSYSVQEVAELFGLHKNAVLNWIKEGLQRIDHQKPYLIYGTELGDFLSKRQGNRKQACKAEEFFCFKCRQPRRSVGNFVTIERRNAYRIKIFGSCGVCGTRIFRDGATKKLPEYLKTFRVCTINGRHIVEGSKGSADRDFRKELLGEQIPSEK